MTAPLRLYGYWRSSAAYRVRIGLALKGLSYDNVPVHLVRDGGEQRSAEYRAKNPQALVPMLEHGDVRLTQSMAILEYLDEVFPETPRLLPTNVLGRARVRALAQLVACDIHPLNNLRVLQRLESQFGAEGAAKTTWMQHWMHEGFAAMETMLTSDPHTGVFCHCDAPGLAECVLVPQLYNAHRFKLPMNDYPTLSRIEAACLKLPAFIEAAPEHQPDAGS